MKTAINLLPVTYQRRLIIRRRVVQWGAVVSAVALAAWAARWNNLREHEVFARQFEVLAREHRPTQAMLREITSMRLQLQEFDQQEKVAKQLDQQRHVLTLLGAISSTASASNGKLRLTEFAVVDLQDSPESKSSAPSQSNPGSLALSGVSLDSHSVAEFLDGLQQTGLFTSVELVSLKEQHNGELALHDFKVRCSL